MKSQLLVRRTSCLVAPASLSGLLTLVLSLAADAATRYTVTDLGTLPGLADSYVFSNPGGGGVAINNRGQVAAYANNGGNPNTFSGDSSYLWMGPDKVKLLPGLPGRTDTMATALNDRGQVVGISGPDGEAGDHGAIWEDGAVRDLGTLEGDTTSWASGINNHGVVIGVSSTTGYTLLRAVAWQYGRIQELPSLPGAAFTEACGINDMGQIVGESGADYWADFHAVLWENGSIIDLGTLGGVGSDAGCLNNRGQIVGQAQTSDGIWHAALWQDRTIQDLGVFGSDPVAIANGINDRGQIVGFSGQNPYDPTTGRALLWQDSAMIELQTLIPANSGWVLLEGNSINDRGQIAGTGLHNGVIRAFLLTPVERH